MTFDHIGIGVRDLKRSVAFYERILAPLGLRLMSKQGGTEEAPQAVGFGAERPDFWLGPLDQGGSDVHVAFVAESRDVVDAFYAAGLAAGGRDNGPPGLRPHYHPGYYAAFVLDPDGVNIEAVCHLAPEPAA